MIHTVSICRREASRGRSLSNESRNDRKNGDVNQKKQLSHAFSHREQTILNEQVKVDDWGESIIQILYSENWSGGIRSALYWQITLIQAIRIKEEINISHSKAVLKATSALWKKSSTSFISMKSVRLQGRVVTKPIHSPWAQKHKSATKPTETFAASWKKNCSFREWGTILERYILFSLIHPQCRHRALWAK